MADLSSVGEAAKSIGDLIAGFVPLGPLRTVVFVVYGLCAVAASLIYHEQFAVVALDIEVLSRNSRVSQNIIALIASAEGDLVFVERHRLTGQWSRIESQRSHLTQNTDEIEVPQEQEAAYLR